MYRLLHRCFHRTLQCATRVKLIYIFIFISLTILLDFFGIFTHFLEITYDSDFVYPYEDDVHEFVNALRHNAKPAVNPINDYNYSYVIENKQKCVDTSYNNFRVVYIIKSAMENADRRSAIRNSWGFEKRFFDVPSRTVFLLGVHPNDDELQNKIKLESAKYKDILQVNFTDTYYNNTIKTMMGFKWLVQHCLNSKFYMFVDDDMYVSVKNVLRFIRNPANYPDYLKEPKKFGAHKREINEIDLKEMLDIQNKMTQTNINIPSNKNISVHDNKQILKQNDANNALTTVPPITSIMKNDYKTIDGHLKNSWKEMINNQEYSRLNRPKRQVFDFELPEDVRLFAGFVIVSSPHRHKSSKWYVPLSEYPYHLWPPYITAGAYILSKEALLDMYYTSLYTKLFRFDDIFLSLVAKKADIEPFHCEEFHFYKKDYTKFNYKYVITSHGYGDPSELLYVWNEQKALGNA